MAIELLDVSPVFREAIDACDQAVSKEVGWSLREVLTHPDDPRWVRSDVIQPAIWAVQVGLAALWTSWGIYPDVVVGYSMGEVAAAYVAGALSLADAAKVIVHRSRLVEEFSRPGAMLVVTLNAKEANTEAAKWDVDVAAINSPKSTVLSGDIEAIEEIERDLTVRGIRTWRVAVSFSSHSRHIDPLRGPLRNALADIDPGRHVVPMYSTVHNRYVQDGELDAEYWVANLRNPVLFIQTVEAMGEGAVFMELSPHPILTTPITTTTPGAVAVASMHREQSATDALGNAVCRLYEAGIDIDWGTYYPGIHPTPELPMYPWQGERFWITPTTEGLLPDVERAVVVPEVTVRWTPDGRTNIVITPPSGNTGHTIPVQSLPSTSGVVTPTPKSSNPVATEIATVLGLPVSQVPRKRPLAKLGMDSFMLMELLERLTQHVGTRLKLTDLLSATVESLSTLLSQEEYHDNFPL